MRTPALAALTLFALGLVLSLVAVRPASASEPRYRGKTAEQWIERLYDQEHKLEKAIKELGGGAQAVPVLRRILEMSETRDGGSNPLSTANALLAVPHLGKHGVGLVPDLVAFARMPSVSSSQRIDALEAVEGLGIHAESAVPELAEIVKSRDNGLVRMCALDALRAIDTRRDEWADAAVEALSADYDLLRTSAVQALVAMPEYAAPAIRVLAQRVTDGDDLVRSFAARGCEELTQAGVNAQPGADWLARGLEDSDRWIVVWCGRSLLSSRPQPSTLDLENRLGVLIRLTGEDPDILARGGTREAEAQALAAALLGCLGEKAAPAIPDLQRLSKSKNKPTKGAALIALGRIESDPAKAARHLVSGSRLAVGAAAGLAARACVERSVDAKQALSIAKTVIKKKHVIARLDAIYALPKIGAPPGAVVPLLRNMLRDKNVIVRLAAVNALAELGTDAADAVPLVTKMLQDDDPGVRAAAEATLEKITPPPADGE